MTGPEIVQIGQVQDQLLELLEQKLLHPKTKPRFLPSALLWGDGEALELFDTYSTIPEYYPTHDEINLMRHWADDIIRHIEPGSALIDLGCGNIHKIKPLLDQLEASKKPVTYYALDISYDSLNRNVGRLLSYRYTYVKCIGLFGTFADITGWAKQIEQPVTYISLGSIFGNDEFDTAVRELQDWSSAMRAQDQMLIGLDGCQDEDRIWKSYNTVVPGKTPLLKHALDISNTLLKHHWYNPSDWEISGVTGSYGDVCTHQWVVRARNEVHCDALDLHIAPGEEIRTCKWFKWGPEGMSKQFKHSGFTKVAQWQSPTGPFYQYLVQPAEKGL